MLTYLRHNNAKTQNTPKWWWESVKKTDYNHAPNVTPPKSHSVPHPYIIMVKNTKMEKDKRNR